jgi:uncharacterized iron-regulated membrane protein
MVAIEEKSSGPEPERDGEAEHRSARTAAAGPGLRKRLHRLAMRPRRVLVVVHRWASIVLLGWVVIVSITGAWLVFHHVYEGWFNPGRYDAGQGDLGPDVAVEAALADAGPDAEFSYLSLPGNGGGVYMVYVEVPIDGAPPPPEGEEAAHDGYTYFVDPGTGEINDRQKDTEGATWWLYRGHMYLWQDHGPLGAFDPASGWCRPDAGGDEPGGVKGVVCDVLPDGMDVVGWFAVLFIGVLLSGFYLWYWPGVRRWATALAIKRGRGAFAFNLSLHKVIGFVVWVPLLVVSFTGIAFAFPNLATWYDNVTPAQRDFYLWTQPEDAVSGDAEGRPPLTITEAVTAIERRYPQRTVHSIMPPLDDETATYSAWVTRGFDPWTRQAGAGNTFVAIDQFTGEVVYDGPPEEGNVFDQLWDDWSFPLHTGDFGGTGTRLLWTGLALTPVALGVTGVVMYVIRLRKRSRRRRRAARV